MALLQSYGWSVPRIPSVLEPIEEGITAEQLEFD